MVIVTTFHIDRARELIINNTNSVKDILLDRLQAISAKLQTVGTSVNDIRSSTNSSSQRILDCLCSDNSSPNRAARSSSGVPQSESSGNTTAILQRTFFSNAGVAIDATRALLGYLPPTRYDVPPATLPLDELYGQLHALHQNSLEWLTHINHNVESIIDFFNPNSLFSQGTPLSRLRDAITTLTRTVDDIHSVLTYTELSPEHASSSKAQTKFEVIERSLEALHQKVDKLALLAESNPAPPQVSPNSAKTPPLGAPEDLPVYQAVHPTTSCRTYGTIIFDGTSSRIPMDILGRPASTALRLDMTVATSSQNTTVSYKMFDDGYLLLSENVETAHKLQHCPNDCLALLHQRCQNFIYKIRSHGLC
ncbi:serine-rich protein [Garlic virus E]|uniref:Serine-rich protein n=1 Tax=Garlic virus E TaxID=150285 RepID=Q8QXW2_9VIRU|nr:serine-rich protein [Garlic virus E]CAC83708.1 serine-rich protein [Garlic virus E]